MEDGEGSKPKQRGRGRPPKKRPCPTPPPPPPPPAHPSSPAEAREGGTRQGVYRALVAPPWLGAFLQCLGAVGELLGGDAALFSVPRGLAKLQCRQPTLPSPDTRGVLQAEVTPLAQAPTPEAVAHLWLGVFSYAFGSWKGLCRGDPWTRFTQVHEVEGGGGGGSPAVDHCCRMSEIARGQGWH